MRKTTITQAEYLQAHGLLALAKQHNAILRDLVEALRVIVGEDDDMGHAADAIYSEYKLADLLKKMGIKVSGKRKTRR